MSTHRSPIAICSVEVTATAEVQLFPAGEFFARDGRPGAKPWRIDAAAASRLIAAVAARKTPLVVDYEHQTLNAEKNGQAAPAAGWFQRLEWREGQGLYAVGVEWTDRAKQMLAAREYRFISPVFSYDRATGEVLGLHSAGLTNTPALDGMDELLMRAAAKFAIHQEEDAMNPILKALLTGLGLAETVTESEALAALKALQDKVKAGDAEVAALKAMQAGHDPDPAKYVPVNVVEDIKTELAALKASAQAKEVDELVKGALACGKLLPAQETWARELGKGNVAALKSYIETAQPIAALKGTQTGGAAPAGGAADGLAEADLAVCKQLGITPAQFTQANKAA